MASENFLINPLLRKRDNPLENQWYGDPAGHRAAALKGWAHRRRRRDNPLPGPLLSRMMRQYGRKRGMKEAWKAYKRGITRDNPFGSDLVLVGANPIRKIFYRKGGRKFMPRKFRMRDNAWFGDPAGHRIAALKGWARRRRRRDNPLSNAWFGDPAGHRAAALKGWAHRRRRRDNPLSNAWFGDPAGHRAAALKGWAHRRRRRDNPVVARDFAITRPMSWMPFVLSGSASAIATYTIPKILKAEGKYGVGVQLGVALGGGYAIGKFVDSKHGATWAIVGMSVIVADLLKSYVFTGLSGLMGLGDEYAYPTEVGAYPEETVSAYPEETISAYPEETISAYPTSEEVVY